MSPTPSSPPSRSLARTHTPSPLPSSKSLSPLLPSSPFLTPSSLIERVYNSLETRDRQLQPTLEPRSPGEKFDKFKAALKKYSGLDYATKKLRKMKEKRKAKKAEKSSTTSNTPGDPAPRPIIKITSGNGGGGVVYPNAQSYGTHSTSKPTSYSHYSGHRPSTSTSHYSSASSPPSPKRHGYNPYTHTTGVFDATKYGYTNPSMSNYAAYPHLSPYCHTGGLDASSGFSHTSGSSYGHGSMGGSGGYYGGGD